MWFVMWNAKKEYNTMSKAHQEIAAYKKATAATGGGLKPPNPLGIVAQCLENITLELAEKRMFCVQLTDPLVLAKEHHPFPIYLAICSFPGRSDTSQRHRLYLSLQKWTQAGLRGKNDMDPAIVQQSGMLMCLHPHGAYWHEALEPRIYPGDMNDFGVRVLIT